MKDLTHIDININGEVQTRDINVKNGKITDEKISPNADIDGSKMKDSSIDGSKLKDGSIGDEKLQGSGRYNFLKGKKVCFFGDSITDSTGYPKEFCELTGAIEINRGDSGTQISGTSNESFLSRLTWRNNDNSPYSRVGLPSACDLIIVYGGINDWGREATFGTMEEAIPTESVERSGSPMYQEPHMFVDLPTTFCGACKMLFRNLRAKYPTTPIVALSLHHVNSTSFSAWNDFSTWNPQTGEYTINVKSNGKTLKDYKDAYTESARMFGVPVIDLFEMGFSALDTNDNARYFKDGLHMNEAGAKKMAYYVADQITKLLHEL